MQNTEPTLEEIEDYNGNESKEKRLTVWLVVLGGLLIGAIYVIITANSTVEDTLVTKEQTGIVKY